GAVADMARSLGSPDVIIIGADLTKLEDSKRKQISGEQHIALYMQSHISKTVKAGS
ncbi:hypothetical protein A2U01_0071601, partial [Trifolium medium]|nr:hypothetical protein [Trifolium medium]